MVLRTPPPEEYLAVLSQPNTNNHLNPMTKLFRVIDEHTWLSCPVPRHLLRYLKDRTTDRKLRLWACAATAHRYAQSESTLAFVALVVAWADGARPDELKSHRRDGLGSDSAWEAAYEGTLRALEKLSSSEKKDQYTEFQLAAVHEIFGNPFRPVAVEPAWRTADVMLLARGIYEDKAFDRMPILADALEEAGCANPAILEHCRDTRLVHLRGCWLIDAILTKQ
jgi:hypothetical protein